MSGAAEEVCILSTERSSMRAEVVGWTHENPALVKPGHIGMTGAPLPYAYYTTVMHALADGWRLPAPPITEDDETVWWLVRTLPAPR